MPSESVLVWRPQVSLDLNVLVAPILYPVWLGPMCAEDNKGN